MIRAKIKTKIWLVLGLLMTSILVNHITSNISAHYNAKRIATVQNNLIPLARAGDSCVVIYQNQISMYQDAVVFGDKSILDQAGKLRIEIARRFEEMLADTYLTPEAKQNIARIFDDYSQFAIAAEYVYGMLASNDADKVLEAQRLTPELSDNSDKLLKRITVMSEHLGSLLRQELAGVVGSTHRVNTVLLVISLLVIILVMLINIFIVKVSIIRPVTDVYEQLDKVQKTREIEGKLYQRNRLESLGELAGGIASEISEPLNRIQKGLTLLNEYSEVVQQVVKLSDEISQAKPEHLPELTGKLRMLQQRTDFADAVDNAEEVISDCAESVAKANGIISDMQSFVSLGDGEPVRYNVVDGVKSVLQIMQREISEKCTVREDFAVVSDIVCYPGEVNQALMNVLHNAVHAVGGGGLVEVSVWEESAIVNVQIKDNGCGMSPDELAHIFDPFYSMSSTELWRGLGLPVAQSIIRGMNGQILVDSQLGKGTVFTIMLPVVARQKQQMPAEVPQGE